MDGVCTFTVSKFSASQLRMRILLNVHLVHGLEQRRLVAEGSPPQAATQASSSGAGQRQPSRTKSTCLSKLHLTARIDSRLRRAAPAPFDENAIEKVAECLPFGQYRVLHIFCSG